MQSLQLQFLRSLNVSAASGLLLLNKKFYVVADDDLSLRIFSLKEHSPIHAIHLLNGSLPEEKADRKKAKPDFEALLHFQAKNSILVIPSGSKSNRVIGTEIVNEKVRQIDFTPIFEFLTSKISELNIEGAVISGDKILLFQRGNGSSAQNGIITIARRTFESDLVQGKLSEKSFISYQKCSLGEIQGHPLSFTDAAVESDNKIWFLAAAESGKSTYEDGNYLGAVLGCLDSNFKVKYQVPLQCPEKPEGLALDLAQGKFYVVTDADDRMQFSKLFEGQLPKL